MRVRRVYSSLALPFATLLLASCAVRIPVPKQEWLGVITGSFSRYRLVLHHDPPYDILLAVPPKSVEPISFSGTLVLRQGSTVLGSYPISLATSQACNWLDQQEHLDGYVLLWRSPSTVSSFQRLLTPGGHYELEVTFTVLPPSGSSLWISSIDKGHFYE